VSCFFLCTHATQKMIDEEMFFFEEEGIEPDRIVNDEHHVADEFFCAICQGLLWKPRSCASCQHLFCNKCIRTWLKINPTSCPFRCSPYEEKRAPPYIHSLLGRLSVRCRNSSFGCTEILPYDLLQQHQTMECQFPTKQCPVCGEYLLLSEIDQHQISCIPTTFQCSLCRCLVDRALFQKHTIECFQKRLERLLDHIMPPPDTPEIPANNQPAVPQEPANENWFIQINNRLQRFLSTMPKINLVGSEAVVQARGRNNWARFWAMFRLIFLNKSRAAQIIILLLCFGIGGAIGCLICLSLFIQNQVNSSIYRSFAFIILFSGLLAFSLPILVSSLSDTFIMLFMVSCLLLWSSTCPELPLENFQICHGDLVISLLYFIIFLIFKLSLSMVRLYCWYIPSYISAGCLAWIGIFVTFHMRRFPIGRR
jgi:hypothetical protein